MTEKKNNQVTNEEILETMNEFATTVDQRFDKVDQRFDKVDQRLDGVEGEISKVKGEVGGMKTTMVTKDYLDDKFADFRGDMVVLMRKEDTKLNKLVNVLNQRKVITDKDKEDILAMEPFART